MTAFRAPLRYRNFGHYLDGAPLDLVNKLSHVALDVQHTRMHGEASDFDSWKGPNLSTLDPGQGGWIVDAVDGGAAHAESVDVRDSAQFGVLRIRTNAADNDNVTVRRNGSTVRYVKGKRLWFAVRIAGQTVNDGEMFFGLAIEGNQNPFNVFPTDGLFFEKAETATKMDFHARKGGASTERTSIDSSVMADDTMRTYALYVDEDGNVHVYVDGTEVATVAAGNANLPNTEDLTVYFAVQTGNAATRYLDVDHYLVAEER